MRVTVYKLFAYSVGNVVYIEVSAFLGHTCVKHNLEKNISEFLFHDIAVVLINAFDKFICFLNEIVAYRLMCLFSVPRTAVFTAKYLHNFTQIIKIIVFLFQQFSNAHL